MSTIPSPNCPYKGLQPYTEDDRKYFFGRERDKEVVASNLYVTPLTVLYGGSGVGKSSVLQAGVIPKLRAKARTVIVYFNEWQSDAFDRALKRQVLDAASRAKGLTPAEALAKA
ncbi:MAG: ATP-binding protein, partial [Acidobacteriota bacterium]|nr:ATP-binding protein [Acidobacteriota bacterium]